MAPNNRRTNTNNATPSPTAAAATTAAAEAIAAATAAVAPAATGTADTAGTTATESPVGAPSPVGVINDTVTELIRCSHRCSNTPEKLCVVKMPRIQARMPFRSLQASRGPHCGYAS